MASTFKITDIYDKHLNILIGAGASYGLFPTLALKVKDKDGIPMTVETLATYIVQGRADPAYTALFMHYYKQCIEPVLTIDYVQAEADQDKKKVLANYSKFIETILATLARKKSGDKKTCNVFTTNYDGCLAHAAEALFRSRSLEFHINDGTVGFKRRFLDARNFNTHLTRTGVFGGHRNDLAQINLIQLHGSAYWYKDEHRIQVDYCRDNAERLITDESFAKADTYSKALVDNAMVIDALPVVDLAKEEINKFWTQYDALPIVNPTKWKFHETVFEEHYYQMLRYLSYELERPNSVLLTFGFSFADEHIRNLVKRSISNPSLQVFICCFDEQSIQFVETHFGTFPNVRAVRIDGYLDFTAFNEQVFTIEPPSAENSPPQQQMEAKAVPA